MRKWISLLMVFLLALSFGAAAVSASPGKSHTFTVVFKSATLPADAAAIIRAAGGTVVTSVPELGIMEVSGPASLMNSLNNHKSILAASPAMELKLAPANRVAAEIAPKAIDLDEAWLYDMYQWDIKQVTNNGASWALGTGSHRTVVGIIDTGINTRHPDLAGNLLGGRNFTPDGPGGTIDPNDIEDPHGHGSHVAGNIAGNGWILGVGPDLGIRAYRVFGATGGAPSSRIAQAMVAAVNDGVDVISMSLGGYDVIGQGYWTDPDTGTVYRFRDVADFIAYRRIVQYAINNGIVVVAAAGNDATNTSNPTAITAMLNAEYGEYGYFFQGASKQSPGNIAGVISVSATGPDYSFASYSNYGQSSIDLSAPGGDFQRWPAPGWHTDMNLSACDYPYDYCWMAGTSMATPKVAAVAALIIDQAKAGGQKINPAQVARKLQQTADDLGKKGYDAYYGHGFVNAYKALGGK